MNLPKMENENFRHLKRRQRAVENQNSHSLEKTHFGKIRDHVRCMMCEDSCVREGFFMARLQLLSVLLFTREFFPFDTHYVF